MKTSPTTAHRFRSRAVGALLAFLVVLGPAVAIDASPAAAGLRLTQYNIQSASRLSNPNLYNARANLTYAVNANQSWYVVVNEVCASDFSYFNTHFQPMAYSAVVAKPRDERCPGVYKWYGEVVYLLGSRVDNDVEYLSNPGLNCSIETTECRVMTCVTANGILGRMTGCGTHLVADNPWLAGYQASEFRLKSHAYAPSSLRWLGGDFNLTPGGVPNDYWANYTLQNVGYTVNPRNPPPTKQIDYIWYRSQGINYQLIPPYCPTDASDHCLVEGDFIG